MSLQPLLASLPTGQNVTRLTAAVSCSPSSRCSPAYGAVLCSQRPLRQTLCHLSSSRRSGCTTQPKRRPAYFWPTISQVAMEGSDPNGRQVKEHPDNRGSFLSHWSLQGSATPAFLSPVLALQNGIRSVRAKGLLQSSKDGFQEAYSGLKGLDGRLVLENIIHSDAVAQGKSIWSHQEPWIKWPIATFFSLYLVILISCGTAVTRDLLPLWIMGPIISGMMVRVAYSAVGFAQSCVVKSEPMRHAATLSVLEVYDDARKGQLVDKTRNAVELKNKEFREALARRRSDFALYIKSGQAASDSKGLLLRESARFRDWSFEKFEDVEETIEPFWRSFSRLMKKLF